MTPARIKRLYSDYEEVKKNFAGHKNIIVTPIGEEPPEKYHVTYFVNGIYLLPDGSIETLGRHEVEISLPSEYPRYKPICSIQTPIWHPNFRDGQICIGDIWGAGESLSDIIVNIGDMIQYKSWNSYSPLSADAAKWAMENKHLFPVGNIDLFYSDYASAKDSVEINLFDENDQEVPAAEDQTPAEEPKQEELYNQSTAAPVAPTAPDATQNANTQPGAYEAMSFGAAPSGNDFDITPEELAGIEFVPTAQRMQTVRTPGGKSGVNFKTIFQKGLLWALIGALVGFAVSELVKGFTDNASVANMFGYTHLSQYLKYSDEKNNEWKAIDPEFKEYCRKNGIDPENDQKARSKWYQSEEYSEEAKEHLNKIVELEEKSDEELYNAYKIDFNKDENQMKEGMKRVGRVSTAIWSSIIALFIGLALGIGEGVFYGSGQKAAIYGAIGAGISLVLGFISGDLAQMMYASLTSGDNDPSLVLGALVRGLGWAILGLGVGVAVGLIRPGLKRILFCCIGGTAGAFLGGFAFDFICKVIPNDFIARGVAILIMGVLIGLGVGLLEQFAKQAWLKVIRGEFEGKEYLVFAGTTSIGNNGKNTIVLFKDKLVGPHHCDIVMDGTKYVLQDCGTPMGTIVNGRRTNRTVLRQGDAIAIGNSVLVFNTK